LAFQNFKTLLFAVSLPLSLAGCAAAVVGGAAAGAAYLAHDRRTVGTTVEDTAIAIKVSNELSKLPPDQVHINVHSYNTAVLLTGEVADPALRQQAERIAAGVEKVKLVHNELIVAPPSSLTSRSIDIVLGNKVRAALFRISGLPDFDPTRVKVVVERGNVYLFGLLRSSEAAAVVRVVRQVDGVQSVVMLFEYIQ